jgi:hypothetical protein
VGLTARDVTGIRNETTVHEPSGRRAWVSRPWRARADPPLRDDAGSRTTSEGADSTPDDDAVSPAAMTDPPNHGVGLRKGPRSRTLPDDASTAASEASEERSESWRVESAGASEGLRCGQVIVLVGGAFEDLRSGIPGTTLEAHHRAGSERW